jgi:hypothetical protein
VIRRERFTPRRPLKGWRTVAELCEELRFPTEDACRKWLHRKHVPAVKRGAKILVDGLDIDRVLRGQGA